MELCDIGVNFVHQRMRKHREAMIERALAAGVAQMVVTGTSLDGSDKALALARSRPGVLYATAGVHPRHAASLDLDALRPLVAEAVAVGECGLDFVRDRSHRADQERAFAAQLALAEEVDKPVFLHERGAHDAFVGILREHRVRGVIHCFTGTGEELDTYLDLGLFVGITGWICDERRGNHLKEIVGRIPLRRLMVETDAPFLVPRDLEPRPHTNEPAFLPHITRVLAAARGEDPEETAAGTTATARAFFGLAPGG